jgi:hypothetical protein
MKKCEAAYTFGLSLSSVKRYVGAACEGRSLREKKRPGMRPKIDSRGRRLLEADLQERPAALEEGTGQKPRDAGRSHRSGNLRGHGPGCPRLLRTLWLPLAGPTATMVAVSHCEARKETELS